MPNLDIENTCNNSSFLQGNVVLVISFYQRGKNQKDKKILYIPTDTVINRILTKDLCL
jgi:hypothetical protein